MNLQTFLVKHLPEFFRRFPDDAAAEAAMPLQTIAPAIFMGLPRSLALAPSHVGI